MKSNNRILEFIRKNINTVCIFLIIDAIINILSAVISIGLNIDLLSFSSFLSFVFAIYAISNVVGYKYGHMFNMHIFRWWRLKNSDRESEYQSICLKYLLITFPISLIWTLLNLCLAVCSLLLS